MATTYDLILTGGTVVNHDGEGFRDIGVSGGRVAAIGDLGQASAGETIDCRGLHILPGVVDSQVHFREPGLEHKEDLETGSRAAVLGGVTAVFEMPNTNPLTTSEAALADKPLEDHMAHLLIHGYLHLLGYDHEGEEDAEKMEQLERVALKSLGIPDPYATPPSQ